MTPGNEELAYALNTFYMLISGALVMWMAAGFAMLEAGLVRAKNTVEILIKNIALFSIACTTYLLVGYQIMYPSEAINAWLPGIGFGLSADWAAGVSLEDAAYSGVADFFFQVVFVATSLSIVSGAVAERMKLFSFLAFAVVFTVLVYPLQGYWKWGGGFLDARGFFDYAGSGVVHLCGAAAALAGVLVVGSRKGKYGAAGEIRPIPGANMPLATLGTFVLWLGWFGFNGGSELMIANHDSANNVARVLVNTNAAAAGGVLAAMLMVKLIWRKAELTMTLNGALAGLVAITADPLSPDPVVSLIIGMAAGALVVVSILFLDKLRIDDPVGAISVHGVCGIFGLLVVAFTNPDVALIAQITGVVVIGLWAFVMSLVIWVILRVTVGVRVNAEYEYDGLDIAECGLEAYPEFTRS